MKQTFYGGKDGRDIVCLVDRKGDATIIASGKKSAMLKLAREKNYAVAEIRALRFQKPKKD
jgi:hypothetical protein